MELDRITTVTSRMQSPRKLEIRRRDTVDFVLGSAFDPKKMASVALWVRPEPFDVSTIQMPPPTKLTLQVRLSNLTLKLKITEVRSKAL